MTAYVISSFSVLLIVGGLVWLLLKAAKTNGAAEVTIDEMQEDIAEVTKIMKEAKQNETLRDKVYRDSLAGKRPNSVRKYDR